LRIDGKFSGTVRIGDGRLLIGPGAEVHHAAVDAASLVVLGKASGTFRTGELAIGAKAHLEGHVEYSESMECALGACINAQVSRFGHASTAGLPKLVAIS
jgi:cytoskeletal protein CcmA (bactofilin family)